MALDCPNVKSNIPGKINANIHFGARAHPAGRTRGARPVAACGFFACPGGRGNAAPAVSRCAFPTRQAWRFSGIRKGCPFPATLHCIVARYASPASLPRDSGAVAFDPGLVTSCLLGMTLPRTRAVPPKVDQSQSIAVCAEVWIRRLAVQPWRGQGFAGKRLRRWSLGLGRCAQLARMLSPSQAHGSPAVGACHTSVSETSFNNKTPFSREPLPCNLTATTALHALIRYSEPSHKSSSLEECFLSHKPTFLSVSICSVIDIHYLSWLAVHTRNFCRRHLLVDRAATQV